MIGFPQFAAMSLTGLRPLGIGIGTGLLTKAALDAVRGEKLQQGETLLSGEPGADMAAVERLIQLNANLTPEMQKKMLPTIQALEKSRLENSLRSTAQLGQIQGSLGRQKYGFQLAGGAQQLGGQVLNTMMANPNPYAQNPLSNSVRLSL